MHGAASAPPPSAAGSMPWCTTARLLRARAPIVSPIQAAESSLTNRIRSQARAESRARSRSTRRRRRSRSDQPWSSAENTFGLRKLAMVGHGDAERSGLAGREVEVGAPVARDARGLVEGEAQAARESRPPAAGRPRGFAPAGSPRPAARCAPARAAGGRSRGRGEPRQDVDEVGVAAAAARHRPVDQHPHSRP